jgi:hypothetical protein
VTKVGLYAIGTSTTLESNKSQVRNRQIEHLESRFVVQGSQIASGLVETLFVAREEDNDRNLFLTKLVIDLAMQIIGSEGHRTPKNATGQIKGEFGQRH